GNLANYFGSEEFRDLAQEKLAERLHQLIVQRFPMAGIVVTEKRISDMVRENWEQIVEELEAFAVGERISLFLANELHLSLDSTIDSFKEKLRHEETRRAWAAKLTAALGEAAPILFSG